MTIELAHLGVLRIDGADAPGFLGAQLTSDVRRVSDRASQLSAWCNAQGRTLATLRVFAADSGYWLLLARDLVEPIARRLRMFVLRAKVTVADVTAEYAVVGLTRLPLGWAAASSLAWNETGRAGPILLVRVGLGQPRWLALAARAELPAIDAGSGAADATAWRALEIADGLPHVSAATSEMFVPQMLNLDALGGVAFDKGCFPGQEIVARLKYRGGLKRRLYRARCDAGSAPAPGTALYSAAAGAEESVGNVVDAVTGADGTTGLTVVVVIERAGSELRIGTANGPRLEFEPLPYSLPDA